MNWCKSHKRMATHGDKCDPKLGGILLPCETVALNPIQVFDEHGTFMSTGYQFFWMYCQRHGVEYSSERGSAISNRPREMSEPPSDEEMELPNTARK